MKTTIKTILCIIILIVLVNSEAITRNGLYFLYKIAFGCFVTLVIILLPRKLLSR